MATVIKTKNGSGAPLASDLVQGELAIDLTNKRLYTENASGTVIELGTVPSTIDINGGTIDGTVIGGSSAAAGSFTSLTATSANVNGNLEVSAANSRVRLFETDTTDLNTQLQNQAGDFNISRLDDDAGGSTLQFSIDHSTGNISIPNGNLDVTGTVTADGLTVDGNAAISSSNVRLDLFETDTTNLNTRFRHNGGQLLIRTTTDDGLTDTTRMSIDHATGDVSLFEDTGTTAKFFWDASAESLGIGTTSPAEKLHIESSTNGENVDIRFRGLTDSAGSGRSANIGFDPDPNGTGTSSEAHLYLSGNTANKDLVVTADGNVGIGTTSVSSKLHVKASVDSVNSGIRLESQDGTEYATIDHNNAGDTRFYQNGVSRMRIDSSGHLLVGTTDAGVYDDATDEAGHNILANGQYYNSTASEINMILNRQNSDGDIAQFRKDGTTVGSIGANSSNAYISGTTRGLHFTGTAGIIPCNEAGAARDADTDIGSSSTRFKDLYLSGGVYLGGTGAANKLDDYEEGTFTATVTPSTSGSVSLYGTNNTLSYTKIGDLVTVMGTIVISATSSPVGSSFEVNLPFTTANLTEASERSTSIVTLNNGSTFTGYAATSVGGVSTMDVHIDPSVLAADNQLYICHTFKAA